MRVVVATEPGKLELSYMWLPTFIGMSSRFKMELERKLADKFVGKPMDNETLEMAHRLVLDAICEQFQIRGLRDYLDALKFVEGPEE